MEKLAIRVFIIQYVKETRLEAPRLGCEKLYVMCKAYFGELFQMGRDTFYRILQESGLMLRLRKRRTRTTDSNHLETCYTNLIRGLVPERVNQLWVSDITYIRTLSGFCYLSLVTDAYSHKIVGWTLAPRLEFHYTQEAVQMALEGTKKPLRGLIHHSDRGFQYAYKPYVALLHGKGIRISMTEHGDPLENAVAERVNGILKQEWLHFHNFKNIEHIRAILEPAIKFYNTRRPHASIDFLTPEQAEDQEGVLRNRWKKKARERTGNEPIKRMLLTDGDPPIV
jgi:transposase InsO family protein